MLFSTFSVVFYASSASQPVRIISGCCNLYMLDGKVYGRAAEQSRLLEKSEFVDLLDFKKLIITIVVSFKQLKAMTH